MEVNINHFHWEKKNKAHVILEIDKIKQRNITNRNLSVKN